MPSAAAIADGTSAYWLRVAPRASSSSSSSSSSATGGGGGGGGGACSGMFTITRATNWALASAGATARASSRVASHPASLAIDGDGATAWLSDALDGGFVSGGAGLGWLEVHLPAPRADLVEVRTLARHE